MFCRHCGTEIPTGSKFCPECGGALIDTAEAISDNESGETEVKPKKSRSKKRNLILIIVLALVAVVALGLLFGDDEEEYKDRYKDEYENDDDDKDDDYVEEDKTESEKLTFKTNTDDNSSKKSADGKYYPGTDILTFTEVTGVPMAEEVEVLEIDDMDNAKVYTYYGYYDDKEVSIIDMANGYFEALRNDGYEEITQTPPEGYVWVGFRKDENMVVLQFEIDEDDESTLLNYCNVAYLTGLGASSCNRCGRLGYDYCQGHTCDICGGRGNQTCSGCNGTGLARVPSSYSNKCVVCYGQGTQICPNCKGAGKKFYD